MIDPYTLDEADLIALDELVKDFPGVLAPADPALVDAAAAPIINSFGRAPPLPIGAAAERALRCGLADLILAHRMAILAECTTHDPARVAEAVALIDAQ